MIIYFTVMATKLQRAKDLKHEPLDVIRLHERDVFNVTYTVYANNCVFILQLYIISCRMLRVLSLRSQYLY